jgi:hypothetical protein
VKNGAGPRIRCRKLVLDRSTLTPSCHPPPSRHFRPIRGLPAVARLGPPPTSIALPGSERHAIQAPRRAAELLRLLGLPLSRQLLASAIWAAGVPVDLCARSATGHVGSRRGTSHAGLPICESHQSLSFMGCQMASHANSSSSHQPDRLLCLFNVYHLHSSLSLSLCTHYSTHALQRPAAASFSSQARRTPKTPYGSPSRRQPAMCGATQRAISTPEPVAMSIGQPRSGRRVPSSPWAIALVWIIPNVPARHRSPRGWGARNGNNSYPKRYPRRGKSQRLPLALHFGRKSAP